MLGMPRGGIDRLLQIHFAVNVLEEKLRRPLILLIATGRAPREVWLAVAQREGRAQRRAWTLARRQGRWMLFIEPEYLRARSESETELWNDGRRLKPTARRGCRDHVAGFIDDVEMHRVAAHFAHAAHGRFAGAKRVDRNTRFGFTTQFDHGAESFNGAGLQFE